MACYICQYLANASKVTILAYCAMDCPGLGMEGLTVMVVSLGHVANAICISAD